MSKKQSRRSVSIRGSTYDQIRSYCERNQISMSEFVEARSATFFVNGGLKETKSSDRIKPEELQDAARIFTF